MIKLCFREISAIEMEMQDEVTQCCDEVEVSTQTEIEDVKNALNYSLAVLANKFLHSSYWFSILMIVFKTNSRLEQKMKTRRTASFDTAERLLIRINSSSSSDTLLLADIAKPRFSSLSVEQAMKTVQRLDEWLVDGVKAALDIAKAEHKILEEELLDQILVDRKILMTESLNMTNA